MNDDQPTHSGDLKHADSNHAVLNDLQNNQLILRPAEKITHTFTKSNPHAWFSYFEKLCIRYKIISDDEKLHSLIPCFDHFFFFFVMRSSPVSLQILSFIVFFKHVDCFEIVQFLIWVRFATRVSGGQSK